MIKSISLAFAVLCFMAAHAQARPSLVIDEGFPGRTAPVAAQPTYPDGFQREYFEDGRLKSEISYKDGRVDGRCRVYYQSGKLKKQVFYRNGIIDGKAFELYENGQFKIEGNYKGGVIDDVNKYYYDNGNLYSFMVYRNGDLVTNYLLDINGRSIPASAN